MKENKNFVGEVSGSEIKSMAGSKGTKVLGTGTHANIEASGFVAKSSDFVVTSLKIDGVAATLTDHWPEGYSWDAGELFTFDGTLTEIIISAGFCKIIKS